METQEKWTDQQIKYIQFLARGKKDLHGRSYTEGEFAKIMGVDFSTIWRWKQKDGFAKVLFEASMKEVAVYLPEMIKAQAAAGLKKGKGGETQAFMALMRQYELLKSDKIDHTTNGKDLPAPILGGVANDD